ncbi:latrophilin receptor-like protein A [Acanthaster planci]|uniref:Latrophilin receptor-like protein A n=1 Tax=Acanthaster planci TaxID=133434 RepID=A0A8B7YES6_ACAPL|nr:latrophilin receptor-like protein A [Acanthaster planci]
MSQRHQRRGIDRELVAYICVAYGIPLTIVSTCLTLQFCDCTDLPVIYAEASICWITDATVRAVTFVVPIAVSLALNIVMYVYTVLQVRRTRQASKVVRNEGTADTVKEELSIYVKICTLVGLTWVFGFVSQSVTGILAFSYIYIILNYLQAVFIFLSFCLNERVRGMWRQKVQAKRTGVPTNSTSQPKHGGSTGTATTNLSAISYLNATTENTKL